MIKEIRQQEREIKRLEKRIENLSAAEAKVRANWKKQYERFLEHSAELAQREIKKQKRGTKIAQKLTTFITEWPALNKKLTAKRDELRAKRDEAKDERDRVSLELKKLQLEWENDLEANDDLIELVFALNDKVVEALEERNNVLTKKVYYRLVKENGDLRRQLTLENRAGTRKLVAMVNSMQIMQNEMAEAAEAEIKKFFERYKKEVLPDNPVLKRFYELTQNVLIDKRNFKPGPSYCLFISLDIDPKEFPELAKAQEFLQASLRSEKTNSYIRLYKRASRSDKWVPIKQS